MTGFGLGWINIAADWSRYQRRDASGAAIVGWNTFGGALAPVVLVVFGLLLAGLRPRSCTTASPPTRSAPSPRCCRPGSCVPFLVAAILALVSGAVLGIYSSGLTLLSLGVRIPRPAAALRRRRHPHPRHDLRRLLRRELHRPVPGLPHHPRRPAGRVGRDHDRRHRAAQARLRRRGALRRRAAATARSTGPRSARWSSRSVLGWGLVVNNFADDASWNNWQGYLLEPLGLGTYVDDPAGALLGGQLALRQPRRAARARPGLRRDLRGPAREVRRQES